MPTHRRRGPKYWSHPGSNTNDAYVGLVVTVPKTGFVPETSLKPETANRPFVRTSVPGCPLVNVHDELC